MKLRAIFLRRQSNRRKPLQPDHRVVIILKTPEDFDYLKAGLSDAETWTGEKYTEVLTKIETVIYSNQTI